MTLLTSLLHLTNFRNPFLRTLIPSIAAAYGIQAAAAVPSILLQTERFYDLSGSITYISCVALSLYLPALRTRAAASAAGGAIPPWPSLLKSLTTPGAPNTFNWRQVLLTAAVTIWATRCKSSSPASCGQNVLTLPHPQWARFCSPASRLTRVVTRASTRSAGHRPSSPWPFSRRPHG